MQDMTVRCPITGRPLKFKELIPIIFTPLPDDEKRDTINIGTKKACKNALPSFSQIFHLLRYSTCAL